MKPKNLLTILAAFACFKLSAFGDVITPTGATSDTTVGSPRTIDKTIDGSGLGDVSDPLSVLDDTHVYDTNAYWLSASTAAAGGTETLTFSLGAAFDVNEVYYWTYERDGDRNIRTFDISYSTDGGATFSTPVSAASLNMADWAIGGSVRDPSSVRTATFDTLSAVTDIRFSNLQNHGDAQYIALYELRFGGQPASVEVGPVDAGNSTVVATPTAVLADGTSISTISVTLRDANGLAVENEGVSLENTAGPGSPTIVPIDIQSTDANGQATFSVSSSTAGTEIFTATAITDSVVITQTASVEFTEVGATQLVLLLDAPVDASTSATGGILENLYNTSMSLDFVGTNTNTEGSFRWVPKDGDGYAGDSVKSQTVIYDMGEIVTFDGFIHAQAHESDFSSVGSIDFWVSNTDPGSDFAAIANTYFGTTPQASKSLNRGDRNIYEYVLDGAKLTGRYVIMRWICFEQATDTGSPGGYTFYLGQTASVGDYDTWSGSYPGLGGPTGDDDSDGLSNEYERLFGLNPLDAGSSNPYAAAFDPTAGTFGYTRRTRSLTGMTYKVWYSTDLEE